MGTGVSLIGCNSDTSKKTPFYNWESDSTNNVTIFLHLYNRGISPRSDRFSVDQ